VVTRCLWSSINQRVQTCFHCRVRDASVLYYGRVCRTDSKFRLPANPNRTAGRTVVVDLQPDATHSAFADRSGATQHADAAVSESGAAVSAGATGPTNSRTASADALSASHTSGAGHHAGGCASGLSTGEACAPAGAADGLWAGVEARQSASNQLCRQRTHGDGRQFVLGRYFARYRAGDRGASGRGAVGLGARIRTVWSGDPARGFELPARRLPLRLHFGWVDGRSWDRTASPAQFARSGACCRGNSRESARTSCCRR